MKKLLLAAGLLLCSAFALANPAPLVDAEVRKVDRDARKVTLKHGEIRHLDMPPMTMVFRVADGALLDKVKAGDKVRVAIERGDAGYVVTRVEAGQ